MPSRKMPIVLFMNLTVKWNQPIGQSICLLPRLYSSIRPFPFFFPEICIYLSGIV